LLSTGSIFWQQRSQHRLSFSPSTPPYFHNSLEDCVLVYLLSSRKRCVRPMCVMITVHMNCVVCTGLSVRICNYEVWIYTLYEACSVSTGSIFWQQRSQHRLSFSPSTPPYFQNFLKDCVLVYLLSSRKRCVHSMCAMTTANMNCVVCTGLSVRKWNCKVWIYNLCEACSVMLRVYSPCAWFVQGRPNPISRRVSMTRNRTLSPHNLGREPFLRCARACTQRWRRRRSKRRILGSSSLLPLVRSCYPRSCSPSPAVWEKLFSRNCSLKDCSIQPRSFSGRSCSTRSGSVRGRSERSGSAKAVAFQRMFSDCVSAQPRRRYSYFLHTYWEPRPRRRASWLRTDDHN